MSTCNRVYASRRSPPPSEPLMIDADVTFGGATSAGNGSSSAKGDPRPAASGSHIDWRTGISVARTKLPPASHALGASGIAASSRQRVAGRPTGVAGPMMQQVRRRVRSGDGVVGCHGAHCARAHRGATDPRHAPRTSA
ncbi:MAG: hypothetical protein ACXWZS_18390 [Gemmatirosa sp.]